MTPQALFRRVAIAEAITWALLLAGMFLKYVTDTTEVGVTIAGPIHGVVFVAYCLTAVVVAIDQRWSVRRTALGLLSAVPPFLTVVFDVLVERRGAFGPWRLTVEEPGSTLERPVGWMLRNPVRGLVVGLAAVAVLTAVALAVGPPVGS